DVPRGRTCVPSHRATRHDREADSRTRAGKTRGMTVKVRRAAGRVASAGMLAAGISLTVSCGTPSGDFEAFLHTPIPAGVQVQKMDGNWGNDPWRCWELSPVDQDLKQRLVAGWNLVPNPGAFNGVASGGKIYCRFDRLDESYSGDGSDAYRAVGIDATKN